MNPVPLLALVLAAPGPAPKTTSCGLFTLRTELVAPDVYVIYQPEPFPSFFYLEGNVTVIVNQADVVVVDAGATPEAGRCLVTAIKAITPKPVRYLVNTHWHGDHTQGNQAFTHAWPGLDIIASSRTRADQLTQDAASAASLMQSTASRKAAIDTAIMQIEQTPGPTAPVLIAAYRRYRDHDLDDRQRAYAGLVITPPTILVDDSLTIRRGDRTIVVRSIGKGDAPGTLVVYLPHDRVIATADLVVKPAPFGFSAEPAAWRQTLGRMDSLDFDVLIPGHGDPQHGHEYLRQLMALIDTVTAAVQRGIASHDSVETIRASLDDAKLGAPFSHGDAEAQAFFVNYFLDPFVPGAYRELHGSAP